MYRFHRRLSSFCRLIRFDHRGMGMSSRIGADKITPACWAEDVVAVMDAVGSEQATIFASGFTAMSALFLAADRPDRVASLVIVNGAARALWAPDYEVGSRASVASPFTTVAIEPDAVEQGFDVLAYLAPSVADDVAFRAWWDAAGNRAASPSMARRSSQALAEADVRDKLPQITAPTLVLHRRDAAFVPVGHGRYLAEHIAGARYVELPGADALYWVGDSAPIIDEIEEFITGTRGGAETERVLTTIVFTDIVGVDSARRGPGRRPVACPARQPRQHRPPRTRAVPGHRGKHRRRRIRRDVPQPECGDPVRVRDRRRRPAARHRGTGGHPRRRGRGARRRHRRYGRAHRCAGGGLAGPSEVLVSSTVREIVTGSRRTFDDRGEHDSRVCRAAGGCTHSCVNSHSLRP